MSHLSETLSALKNLRAEVNRTDAALLLYERKLAVGHAYSDEGHRELHGLLHRMQRLTGDLKNVLAEPVPGRARPCHGD